VATTTDGQKYFTARVRTETKKGTTQIAKSDSALARHAKNPTNTPIPNNLGPTSIFIDAENMGQSMPHCMDPLSEEVKYFTPNGIGTKLELECPNSPSEGNS
jgi:hypothetical protein